MIGDAPLVVKDHFPISRPSAALSLSIAPAHEYNGGRGGLKLSRENRTLHRNSTYDYSDIYEVNLSPVESGTVKLSFRATAEKIETVTIICSKVVCIELPASLRNQEFHDKLRVLQPDVTFAAGEADDKTQVLQQRRHVRP